MKNKLKEYFMIEIVIWMGSAWPGPNHDRPHTFQFGPYPSKEEMNSVLHKLRTKFKLTNHKICADTKWTKRELWNLDLNKGQWLFDLDKLNKDPHPYIGYKRIHYWNSSATRGFWKTMKVLKHGDEEIDQARVWVKEQQRSGVNEGPDRIVPKEDRPVRTFENLEEEMLARYNTMF